MKTYIFNGKFMSDKYNEKSVFIAMEGDNNSGVISFELDRYSPDRKGVDLGAFAWQLEVTGYILPAPHMNIVGELTGLAKEVRGSTISVRWTVGGENTFLSGEGEAQLKAIGANGEVWKSEPFTVVVGQSINADGVAELYPGILTELSARALALEGRMDTAESDIETLQGNVDALGSDKQDKYDETLTTTDKTVVGAINEVKNASDIAKQTADGAKNTAEAIDGKATEALSTAEEALSEAGEAKGIADSAVQTESDPTVPAWAKAEDKPEYTAAEIAGLESITNLVNYYKKSETYTQTEVNNLISAIPKLTITVVEELPAVGDPTKIYVVGNKEYLWLADEERYEQFGDLSVDLSGYYDKDEVDALLAGKVNIVAGKGLSTEDYTTTEKSKLTSIQEGAQVNPSIATQAEAEAGENNAKMMTPLRVKQAINELAPATYDLPTASETVKGGIKVGTGLVMNGDILSATGGEGGGTKVNFYIAEDFDT